MRAVVQRVKSASVEVRVRSYMSPGAGWRNRHSVSQRCVQVGGEIVSQIGPGLLCLIGVKDTDTAQDQEYM